MISKKMSSIKLEPKNTEEILDHTKFSPKGEEFFWSDEYISVLDQNFDEYFEEIYKEIIVGKLFGLS